MGVFKPTFISSKLRPALRGTLAVLAVASVSLLAGCGKHPASGTWKAAEKNDQQIWLLKINFDGSAKIFSKSDGSPMLGCLWFANDAEQVSLQCATSENPETPEIYILKVSEENRATFSKDDQVLARLNRQS